MCDSAHVIYWKNSLKLAPNFTIKGYSRAAENTGFYCAELDMAFDAGCQTNDIPAFICLSHLHSDHTAALHKMLIDNPKKPIIFIPNNAKFEELLITCLKNLYLASKFIHPMSKKGMDPNSKYPYTIVKLDVGQCYKFKESKGSAYYVEGLPANHGVTSISFGIYQMRIRCQAQYKNLDKKEYVKMKEQHIDFTEIYKHHIFCYMSDTNIKPLIKYPQMILSYPVVMVECTFLEQSDLPHAKKKNHMHWLHLEPIIRNTLGVKFLLIHFSKKYTWSQIKIFFDQVHNNNPLFNVGLWLQPELVHYYV